MSWGLAGPLNVPQLGKAVDSLLTHSNRKSEKSQLFEQSAPLSIIIALKKIPSTNGRTKPYMM